MKEIFFETFFSLVRLFLNTKNEFLKEKLVKKTREFFDAFQNSDSPAQLTDFATCEHIAKSANIPQHDKRVAQHWHLLQIIDILDEFVEILLHLKISDLSPALLVQKNLFRLRLEIMDFVSVQGLQEKKETNHIEKPKNKAKNSKYKNLATEILQIFKDKPGGLSLREIISCLQSRCSRRTLQRSLNKLVSGGFLLKKGLHNSATYFIQGPTLYVDNSTTR